MTTRIIPNICALLLLVHFASCKKAGEDPLANLSDLTREVLSQPTLLELKQGQALLSVTDREKLWHAKLDYLLRSDQGFTKEQLAIIQSLKNLLASVGMKRLMSEPAIGSVFLQTNLPRFSRHFTKEQLNILVESPYLKNGMRLLSISTSKMLPFMPIMTQQSAAAAHCTCNWDLGCPGAGNNCDRSGCTANNELETCGLFGTEKCGERCSGIQPDMDVQ